jgi:A/G-specific adenine glycosylase
MHQRDLPWRHDKDPYKIWLSEVILQQTRVNQGLPYYLNFVDNYPTINDLANADINDVLKLWQGLGYYSRAHNLHKCAVTIVNKHNAKFPTTKKELMTLPGIGDYTASAIASIAFAEKVVVLDGNVFRVLSRFLGIEEYIDIPVGRKAFQKAAEELIEDSIPGEFNQAMMEFGALQCVPKSPNCQSCTLNSSCAAFNSNQVNQLPRKKGKTKVKEMFIAYYCVVAKGSLAMIKRDHTGIWKGMFEMPSQVSESPSHEPWRDLRTLETLIQNARYFQRKQKIQHLLSHRKITAEFFVIELNNPQEFTWPGLIWTDSTKLNSLAVHTLIDNFFKTPEGIEIHSMIES